MNLAGNRHPIWDSRRLWSLWDMIDFGMVTFWQGLEYLSHELNLATITAAENDGPVDDGQHARISQNIKFVFKECVARLQIEEANRACLNLEDMFGRYGVVKYTYSQLRDALRRLHQDIKDGAVREEFFHYPRGMAKILHSIDQEWRGTLGKFPSSKADIVSATDCYALGHHTACVFHLMRVAEAGLRALARERSLSFPDKPIEWAQWQELIDRIDAAGKAAAKALPKGDRRDAALGFYTGSAGQFHAFKNTYRNAVMHLRRSYDEFDAWRAINQVRDFMNGLSAKIGEKTRKPIARWP